MCFVHALATEVKQVKEVAKVGESSRESKDKPWRLPVIGVPFH